VWRQASANELTGWVGNDQQGVLLEVEGDPDRVQALLCTLHLAPPLARVDTVSVDEVPATGATGFAVLNSDTGGATSALLPPDTAMCERCSVELTDPADRRHGHPFLTCTDCGPRFTVVEAMPYDRSRTTMAKFPLYWRCQREYDDPADRRFHAEPLCCPACGPQLRLLDARGREQPGEPLAETASLLRGGAIVAVKGVGGYHLAVDANDEAAVARLRARKHRPHRPFALLVTDLAEVDRFCRPTEVHRT